MSRSNSIKRRSIIGIIALSGIVVFVPMRAVATSFTAGVVMEKMDVKERYAFVAGIVEGLAMARYVQDGKKIEGMNCIYDWFYQNPKTAEDIYAAFQRYPDYPPGTVVDVMVRKTCS